MPRFRIGRVSIYQVLDLIMAETKTSPVATIEHTDEEESEVDDDSSQWSSDPEFSYFEPNYRGKNGETYHLDDNGELFYPCLGDGPMFDAREGNWFMSLKDFENGCRDSETKTAISSTSTSTTSSTSIAKFYRASFVKDELTSIPICLFDECSVTAMLDGMERNPYAHWKVSDSFFANIECKHEYSRHKFDECADCKQKAISSPQICKEEEWFQNIHDEDATNNREQHMSMLHACGVSVEWLLAFTFAHDCWNRPTWWVNRHIIKEATSYNRCRYMHLPEMKKYAGPATIFISHCWGAQWGDVVLAACHGARRGRVVWIDLFAVRQWPGNEADLDFRGVISKCKALIVSISPVDGLKEFHSDLRKNDAFLASWEGQVAKRRIPVFRLWCNVEIAAAYKKIPIIIKGGSAKRDDEDHDDRKEYQYCAKYLYDTKCVGHFMQNLKHMIDVELSETTNQADYDREMKVVRGLDGGIQGVNKLIAGVVQGGAQSIKVNILEIDAYVCNEKESFRALNIPSCCEGKEKKLARKVLKAAGAGGRIEIVRELLLRWDVKGKDDNVRRQKMKWLIEMINNSRVIQKAAGGGHAKIVDMLLQVDEHVDSGSSLFISSSMGFTDVVQVLLKNQNVDVNQIGSVSSATSLCVSCQNGFIDIVKLLLDIDEIDVNLGSNSIVGLTPLYSACQQGHTNIVKLLISKITDIEVQINRSKEFGSSPLYISSTNGHSAVVKQLLGVAGVDVNRQTNDGATPLLIACSKGHAEVVSILLSATDINVNRPHNSGLTPLFVASQKGLVGIVSLLLDSEDLNINQSSDTGATPLHVASSNAHADVVELLLAASGIKVNQVANEGSTSLIVASSKGHENIVQLLLAAKDIDVNQSHNNGHTSLCVAIQRNYIKIVKLLLGAQGMDVNRLDEDQRTPLWVATAQGKLDSVVLLLQQPNIDVNKKDKENLSPLDIAHSKLPHGFYEEYTNDIGQLKQLANEIIHYQIIQLLVNAGGLYFKYESFNSKETKEIRDAYSDTEKEKFQKDLIDLESERDQSIHKLNKLKGDLMKYRSLDFGSEEERDDFLCIKRKMKTIKDRLKYLEFDVNRLKRKM